MPLGVDEFRTFSICAEQKKLTLNLLQMGLKEGLIEELKYDSSLTRKILEQLPDEHFSWKPHEKSMTLGELASHTANLLYWVALIVNQDNADIADRHPELRKQYTNKNEMIDAYQNHLGNALRALKEADDNCFGEFWTFMRNGEGMFTIMRKVAIRNVVYNHTVHHRGQLTVYLRLLNIPVPGLYGPSADEK